MLRRFQRRFQPGTPEAKVKSLAVSSRRIRPGFADQMKLLLFVPFISHTRHGTAIYADQLTPPGTTPAKMAVSWSVWVRFNPVNPLRQKYDGTFSRFLPQIEALTPRDSRVAVGSILVAFGLVDAM